MFLYSTGKVFIISSLHYPVGGASSMKGIFEIAAIALLLAGFAVADFLRTHVASILFSIGLTLLVIGFAMIDISLAFIVPGLLICGLIIAHRLIVWRAMMPKQAEAARD